MKSQAVLGSVLAVAVTAATGADDPTAPWGLGLPIVEATKTEVGPGKYLWGSTLLLAVPDKFQGYWPDYGYHWSNAAYIELCGGRGKSNEVESANLGRVRLVAEAGEKAERLIGLELRTDGEKSDEEPGGKSQASGEKTEFTVRELCVLLDDDIARKRVETMVRLMAGSGMGVLETGVWHGKKMDEGQDLGLSKSGLSKSVYMLIWKGWGVDEGLDVTDKVSWIAEGKPVIVWEQPREVNLRTGYGTDATGFVAIYEQPGYMLTKMGGVREIAFRGKPTNFQVTEGSIATEFLTGGGKFQPAELGKVVLSVWADVAKYEEMTKPMDLKVWLVTENAIPKRSLVPEIRVGDGD